MHSDGPKEVTMVKNVHPVERVGRVVVGALLASMAFWGPTNYWFLLGLVLVPGGLLGWCPLYWLLGINTATYFSGRG
jgi:hypothetical protein